MVIFARQQVLNDEEVDDLEAVIWAIIIDVHYVDDEIDEYDEFEIVQCEDDDEEVEEQIDVIDVV